MSVVAFAQGFSLPPGKPRVSVRNACVYTMARPLKAFAFRVHAHALGVEVYAERLVGGRWPKDEDEAFPEEGRTPTSSSGSSESFRAVRLMGRSPQLAQLFERIDDSGLTIHPGDKIRVTCVYDTSNRTEVTRAGWTISTISPRGSRRSSGGTTSDVARRSGDEKRRTYSFLRYQ